MPDALTPWSHRPFRHLFIGTTANLLGNGVAPIALAFAVLDATGSVGSLGLVVGAHSLTGALFLLFGGVLADRLPRGRLLVASSAVSAASQAVVAALVLTHNTAIPLLMALAAVNGASGSCYQPAAQALLPQTVPAESRRAALALSRIAGSSAMIVGASLGGVLVATVGPGLGLAVDALSFALAAASFALVRVQVAPSGPSPGVVYELRLGWREFTSRTWVWVIVVAFCFLNAGLTASFTVLGPAVADASGIGRSGWGLALAAGSLGAVAGGVLSLRWRPRRAILVGCALMGLTATIPLLLALAPYTWLLVVANFVAGVGAEQAGVAWYSTLNEQIPEDRLARVYAYDDLGSYLALPFAQFAAGPAVLLLGLRTTLYAAAALILLATLAMVATPSVRALAPRTAEPQRASEDPVPG
ncbi:MFS transporter [Streptomyces sp. ID05-04B]|uniref:MFS transporter n=1 Tax=unclassified Streptomyces TaxID=2593676 RepID=UPI000D1B85D5|nr:MULTISPECIES: MFS transporter [unclassified Streptomyces]AVV46539.1 MFS transporter [Streptomyces sp. P3]MDX5565694.1 MFS transporter [Streptomyces sp. ID05-04B]